ncbi:hypothetical protein D3C73_1674750 [compost metagenome]
MHAVLQLYGFDNDLAERRAFFAAKLAQRTRNEGLTLQNVFDQCIQGFQDDNPLS